MLPQTCEYALRAMTWIARQADGAVQAKDIASDAMIPLQYLQKLLTELVKHGFLASTRGVGGGFRLARPASDLGLAEILAPFDDLLERSRCPFGNLLCGKSDPCPVHSRWEKVMQHYRQFLESTTLADLVAEDVRSKRPR